jgi:Zn-dependent protease with chaperone function
MIFPALLTLVLLAAFTIVSFAASVAVALSWRLMSGRILRMGARARSTVLLAFRLLPGTLGIAAIAGPIGWAFWLYEPRDSGEYPGAAWWLAAAIGLTTLALHLSRTIRGVVATRALMRSWLHVAQPLTLSGLPFPVFRLDSDMPIVALLGVWRPRLFVSNQVLASCTAEELRLMAAHEASHWHARDNAKRLACLACPDFLIPFGAAKAIEAAWGRAVEERADERAAEESERAAVTLASALVKVARLGTPLGAAAVPVSTLIGRDIVEERVRRLLAPRVAVLGGSMWTRLPSRLATVITIAATFALMGSVTLQSIHWLIEELIHRLP